MDYTARQSRLRNLLDEHGLSTALYCSAENVRYLSGFTGSNGQLLIDTKRIVLLTDGRYRAQAHVQASVDEIVIYEQLGDTLGRLAGDTGLDGFESEAVTVAQWTELSRKAPVLEGAEPLPRTCVEIRVAKDADELDAIQRAIEIAEQAWKQIQPRIRPGAVERELALALEWEIRTAGSRTIPFEFIVASGERSAMPHGIASERRLQDADPLTVDFGGEHDGYFSDMTFAGSVGRGNAWIDDIVAILCEAQDAALDVLRAGVRAADVDRAARDVIERAGYGDAFSHSLGHGVGLAIHEAPRLSRLSEEILPAGAVITIEPGIYVPGRGGARIEDMVVVTDDGYRKLTSVPKLPCHWSSGS